MPLHKSRCTKPVTSVIAKICLTYCIKTRYCRLQIVVYPKTSHCIVNCRVDHHRLLVRVDICYLLIHLKQISIPLFNHLFTQSLCGSFEIQKDSQPGLVNTISCVTSLFCRSGCHVPWDQVTESRVSSLQIIISILLRYLREDTLLSVT